MLDEYGLRGADEASCKANPDEKGTESMGDLDETTGEFDSCKANPDEKGTESFLPS